MSYARTLLCFGAHTQACSAFLSLLSFPCLVARSLVPIAYALLRSMLVFAILSLTPLFVHSLFFALLLLLPTHALCHVLEHALKPLLPTRALCYVLEHALKPLWPTLSLLFCFGARPLVSVLFVELCGHGAARPGWVFPGVLSVAVAASRLRALLLVTSSSIASSRLYLHPTCSLFGGVRALRVCARWFASCCIRLHCSPKGG